MTLNYERRNSIIWVRDFLREICKPGVKLTKKQLRHEVKYLLKHYPTSWDLGMINMCKRCRDIIGEK